MQNNNDNYITIILLYIYMWYCLLIIITMIYYCNLWLLIIIIYNNCYRYFTPTSVKWMNEKRRSSDVISVSDAWEFRTKHPCDWQTDVLRTGFVPSSTVKQASLESPAISLDSRSCETLEKKKKKRKKIKCRSPQSGANFFLLLCLSVRTKRHVCRSILIFFLIKNNNKKSMSHTNLSYLIGAHKEKKNCDFFFFFFIDDNNLITRQSRPCLADRHEYG